MDSLISILHFQPLLAVMGWDDLILAAIASAMANGAVSAATAPGPSTSAQFQNVPKPDMQGMDFQQLVGQQGQQSNLPKAQLQLRDPFAPRG